jgi:hypothetical protein
LPPIEWGLNIRLDVSLGLQPTASLSVTGLETIADYATLRLAQPAVKEADVSESH